ncbi:MAG: hypothetical protein ACRER2_06105, partial [Methylococcales bacterium]
LPRINEYRAEIVASIGESFGKPIEMDSMSAGLNGIHPEVVLNGVKIIDPVGHQTLLRFDQLRAGLNVKEWLSTGNFQPRWVTIRGARLSVRRKLDGSFSVVGLDSGAEMPKWIFEDGRFELLDSEVDWQDLKHPAARLYLSKAAIRLLNRNTRHAVAVDADLPQEYGKSLSIRMDLEGGSLAQECCAGTIYMRADNIFYGKLLEGFALDGYRVAAGQGGFRLWSTWKKSLMVDLAGEVDMRDAKLAHKIAPDEDLERIANLQRLAGGFHWLREENTWKLSINHILVNASGEAWPSIQLDLQRTFETSRESSRVQFNASYLKLDDLRKWLLDLQALAPESHEVLAATAPNGEIFDLKLGFSNVQERLSEWYLCARFEHIGFNPRDLVPGAKNLSGNICGRKDSGRFQLASAAARIELPEVFREPIDLASLDG